MKTIPSRITSMALLAAAVTATATENELKILKPASAMLLQ